MYYFCTPRQSAYCVLTALAEFLRFCGFFTVIASAAKQSHEDCADTIEYGATTREIAASPAAPRNDVTCAFFTVIASAAKQSHEDCTGTIEYGAATREIAASPAAFSLSLRAQRSNLMRIAPVLLNTVQQRGRLPRRLRLLAMTLQSFMRFCAFFTVIASAAKQSHEDCTGAIEYGATTREIAASPAAFSLSLRAQRSNLMRIAPVLLNTVQQRGRLPRRLRLLAMTGKGKFLAMTLQSLFHCHCERSEAIS